MMYTPIVKRTQMYFDDEDWARLQAYAESLGRSAASVARDAVAEYLAGKTGRDDDPILALIREAEAETRRRRPTDGALNHDHYLYGWPKEGASWPERND